MPQKAAVENNRVGQNWLGVTHMMTGYCLYPGMLRYKIRQAGMIQNRVVFRTVHRGETCVEFTLENGGDRAPPVLEDVIVDDQEPRR